MTWLPEPLPEKVSQELLARFSLQDALSAPLADLQETVGDWAIVIDQFRAQDYYVD